MKQTMTKFASLLLGGILTFGVLTPLAACTPKIPALPVWEDDQVEVTESGVTLTLAKVDGASEYQIYHSPSRFGEYTLVSTQTELTYSNTDTYGYYRVNAMSGSIVLSTQWLSYDLQTFGENTSVYATTDDAGQINAEIDERFETLEAGQFSTERYGVLFKEGEYPNVKMQMGYYTTVGGLGLSPEDVTLGYFNVNAQWFSGNATHNFWRGIENVTVDGNVQWAVSQATSFRRMNVLGNMTLDDGGWSSGGYIADTKVSGNINSGSQQQWFTRNSSFSRFVNGGWSRVFVGCEGTVPSGEWPSGRSTVIDSADVVAEKPFLTFSESEGYSLFLPETREEAAGVSWDGDEIYGESILLDEFYVARADRDTAETMNAALQNGKHLLLTPGIYELDEPLVVENADTIVFGMGLATLKISDTNTDTLMRVKDVGGVRICGILFDAGTYSNTLLEVGEEKTSVSHADNRIYLSDLYFRVGGAEDKATCVAESCLVINANDVIGDHFWVWRADHSYGVGWGVNVTKNGIVVNGDDVTIYALMVEHFHEYQTVWNGENGYTYFYQSETPYDPTQEEWMSHDGAALGYSSYKVGDDVTTHHAYGVGIYGYPSGCYLENAIEAPEAEGVYFEHIVTIMLSGSRGGGINNVINGVGGAVSNDQFDQTIGHYYNGQIQD